jgi:hypothetical protein
VNWYKLEEVRETLRDDFGCDRAPSGVGATGNLEVWQRVRDDQTHRAFLNYENLEFLVPEDAMLAAVEALQIPVKGFMAALKAKGGLYLGPDPE